MGRDPVLIVGVSTRAFAESASRAGYACLSVDAFGDLDQKQRAENVGLLRDRGCAYSVTAAVAVARALAAPFAAYNGNLENHPAAVERLAQGRVLWATRRNAGPASAISRRFPVARKAGERSQDPPARTLRGRRGAWRGCASRCGAEETACGLGLGVPVRPRRCCRSASRALGSMTFAADGRRAVVLEVARALAGDRAVGSAGFRYCGSLFPSPGSPLLSRLDDLAQAATREFGLRGVNGIDFVVRDGEAYVLELNPRYSGYMEVIERGLKRSVFEIHRAACDGTLSSPPPPPARVFGKAILWARGDRVARRGPGSSATTCARRTLSGDRWAGQPICTVFAEEGRGECYDLVAVAEGFDRGRSEPGQARMTPPGRLPPRGRPSPEHARSRGGSMQARLPLVYGLVNSTVEAQRRPRAHRLSPAGMIDSAASATTARRPPSSGRACSRPRSEVGDGRTWSCSGV
jgi:hypothetical protein